MGIYKRNDTYWYRFNWYGKQIRESTKQGNPRVARQIEAAHKTALAKGEVGIRERRHVPTVKEFSNADFLPFVRSTFQSKGKTKAYYENGVKNLLAFDQLADTTLDDVTSEKIAAYIGKRQADGLQVASINRELQVLRRIFALALEWGRLEKALPKVRMLSGERHRERVLSDKEEAIYLANANPLLRHVATILLDCGLRPEECFRLQWGNIRQGVVEVHYGKTENARRRIPMSQRVAAVLEMRKDPADSRWVFPASTKSGHIEPSTLKKQHAKACRGKAEDDKKTGEKRYDVLPFPLYTLRHTCLTRWAPHMDPWTLAYLAGHRDMSITKRYIHPQQQTIRSAMERATRHNSSTIPLVEPQTRTTRKELVD
jgi:integrase